MDFQVLSYLMSEVLTRWEMFFGAYWDVEKLPWPLWEIARVQYICTYYYSDYYDDDYCYYDDYYSYYFGINLRLWIWCSCCTGVTTYDTEKMAFHSGSGPLTPNTLRVRMFATRISWKLELLARKVQFPGHQMPDSFQNFKTYFIAIQLWVNGWWGW